VVFKLPSPGTVGKPQKVDCCGNSGCKTKGVPSQFKGQLLSQQRQERQLQRETICEAQNTAYPGFKPLEVWTMAGTSVPESSRSGEMACVSGALATNQWLRYGPAGVTIRPRTVSSTETIHGEKASRYAARIGPWRERIRITSFFDLDRAIREQLSRN